MRRLGGHEPHGNYLRTAKLAESASKPHAGAPNPVLVAPNHVLVDPNHEPVVLNPTQVTPNLRKWLQFLFFYNIFMAFHWLANKKS